MVGARLVNGAGESLAEYEACCVITPVCMLPLVCVCSCELQVGGGLVHEVTVVSG